MKLSRVIHTDDTIIDLNDLLVNGAGWELIEAADINDVGQIVGQGRINGAEHGFLLTPVPEPAALGLLTLCNLVLMRRRR